MTHFDDWIPTSPHQIWARYLDFYMYLGVAPTILGLLLTLLTLALTSTRQTCCSCSCSCTCGCYSRPDCSFGCGFPLPNCCCTCFTLPRVEYGALLPSKPYAPFVLDVNGKPKPVPEDEKVKTEETELVANEEAKKTEKQDDELVANQAEYNLDMDKVMV